MTIDRSLASRDRKWNWLAIALIVPIVLLSIRSFAAAFTPGLNSDHAVHVLMAYHLKLPDDFYYWGQDRLGSLVPVLSHFLLKILPLPVVVVVSIVQYGLLIFGYLCLASLLRHAVSRLALALVWFLPLVPFTELDFIGQPYGPQIALIGAACVAIDRLSQTKKIGQKRLWLATATACLFFSLWVSDFTIVPLFLLSLWGLSQLYKAWKLREKTVIKDAVTVLLTAGLGVAFVEFAKNNASSRRNYSSFATPEQSIEMLRRLLTSFWNTLTFQTNNLFLSWHAILAVILLGYLAWAIAAHRQKILRSTSRWFYLFLGTVAIGMPLLLISFWVYRNGLNLRYFTVIYVMAWLAVLLLIEALPTNLARTATILMLMTAIASSLSLPLFVYTIQRPIAQIQQLQEIKALGNAGFIGDYWRSYILCSVDPANLNCTPHDPKGKTPCPPADAPPHLRSSRPVRAGVRCRRCIPQVFASDTIYLVKDKWLNRFPAETEQFRRCLVRAGRPQKVSGYTIAPYRIKAAAERRSS
ncbi:hypothetical protein H6F67_11930 [Microcoleus sp. FACHB-1515]|uniref:hypothetical protein n=1 Tax=Cyanophyceae TaxID=3028117 RepID=UPI001688C939|nr:hypothetical protein [Microcoleus sp. FACHB-1515]MBD2090563.1 hypothetical protein [Microcoleus sp. FACHB-1515]